MTEIQNIDLYEQLPSDVRVEVKEDFATELKSKLKEKYGTLRKYCEGKKINFSTFQSWFTNLSRGLELSTLVNIASGAGINKEKIYSKSETLYTNHKENGISLPRTLKVSEKFLKGLGLYVGEGQRKSNEVALSNTEPEILNFFVKWLEGGFDIDKGNIICHIYVPEEGLDEGKIKKEWAEKLILNQRQIKNVHHYDNSQKECCLLIYGNKIIHSLINSSIESRKKLIENEEDLILSYLRGLFAAEGHVRVEGQNVHHIELGMKDKDEIYFISQLLETTGIDSSIKNNNGCFILTICRKENIERLVEEDLFELHPSRKKKLESALDNFSQSQVGRGNLINYYASYFLENDKLTVNKLMNLTDKSKSQCRRVIKEFYERNMLEESKTGDKYFYFPCKEKVKEVINN